MASLCAYQTTFSIRVALYLDAGALRCGLMRSSPAGPGDDAGGPDAALCQPDGDAADLVDRPADQLRRGFVGILFGGGGWFAWWRIAASMAKASMAKASMTNASMTSASMTSDT